MHFGIISIPGSPKTWTWTLSPLLPPKITDNHKIMPKVSPRRLPKIHPKINKTGPPGFSVSIGCPLEPRITKMVSQVSKKEPQGLQNDSFKLKSYPFQQVPGTRYQVPGTRLPKYLFTTSRNHTKAHGQSAPVDQYKC